MNRHRSRTAFFALGSFVLLSVLGCASARPAPKPEGGSAPSPSAGERELEIARRKLRIAELELEQAEKTRAEDQTRTARELELAQAELRQFDEVDAPDRLASERLSVVRAKDSMAEQEEELAQLEMTYAEVDLSDKTREIVLRRNHRRVERAKEELAIEERELVKLEQHALPLERAKLALEVEAKTHALESVQRTAEIGLLGKQISLEEARAALEKQEKDRSGSAP
jgi:hypothetical protein